LIDPTVTTPTLQDYLAIAFSPDHPLERFRTKVNDIPLADDYGFNQQDRTYYLRVQDVLHVSQALTTPSSFRVEVSFQQGEIVHQSMGVNLVELDINSNLLPSSMKLIFKLPSSLGILSKLNYYLHVLIKRKRERYEIEPYLQSARQPSDIDRRNGLTVFVTSSEIKGPVRFSYRPIGKVDWPSLALGAILAVVASVITDLLVRWIFSVFGGST
jgi:hypothetical protein